MIARHPGDDLLLPHAAGRLRSGQALLLDTHLETCAECRARMRLLLDVGGALLEDVEGVPLQPASWARTLQRIDAGSPSQVRPKDRAASVGRKAVAGLRRPTGWTWPRRLGACPTAGWRWMGPGMRYARVTPEDDPDARLYLLWIGPGRYLPRHTHDGVELTQVLYGQFDDGRAVFGAGDFDAADDDVHHQPIVSSGGECICLAYVDGRLRFDGKIASAIGGWIGM